jgi:hypothetical protein
LRSLSSLSCFFSPCFFFNTHETDVFSFMFVFLCFLFGFCTTYGERCLLFPAPIFILFIYCFYRYPRPMKTLSFPPRTLCTPVCVCVCVWVRACTRACMRACVHACVSACMRVCVCMRRACVCVVGRNPSTGGRESIYTLSHPSVGGERESIHWCTVQ